MVGVGGVKWRKIRKAFACIGLVRTSYGQRQTTSCLKTALCFEIWPSITTTLRTSLSKNYGTLPALSFRRANLTHARLRMQIRRQGLGFGYVAFLPKPILNSDLTAAIVAALGVREVLWSASPEVDPGRIPEMHDWGLKRT
jgi:hypothetical protein